MKRTYECMVLLDNREVKRGWQALKEWVNGLFAKHGAQVISSRLWEERQLAFPIKGQRRGTYLLLYFDAESRALPALNRDLEFAESVLRHVVLTCEQVPAEAHEPEKAFDVASIAEDTREQPAPAAEPAPQEQAKRGEGGEKTEAGERTAEAAAGGASEKKGEER